jgi:hypothetical protein
VAPEAQLGVRQGRLRPRTGFERVVERGLLLLSKAIVAILVGACVWMFGVASLFLCCAITGDAWSWFPPTSGAFGPWITILVVWPVTGLVCLVLQSILGDLPSLVGKGAKRLFNHVRSRLV